MKRFNDWLAVKVTDAVGTMYCVYLFAVIGITSLVGVVTNNLFIALFFGGVSSYFFQLVLIPVLMVGQKVQTQRLVEHAEKLDALHEHLGVGDKGESES